MSVHTVQQQQLERLTSEARWSGAWVDELLEGRAIEACAVSCDAATFSH